MGFTKMDFDNSMLADRLTGIGEYYFSKKMQQIYTLNEEGKQTLNLGIGSPDMPPHESVIEELRRSAQEANAHGYQSYRGLPQLREAFAGWYKRYYNADIDAQKEVLPLIGSKEGIVHICMTYLNKDDEVLIPNPGYPAYSNAIKMAGAKPVYYDLKEENAWQIDMSLLEKKLNRKTKMMWINSPHMPTGSVLEEVLLEQLVAFAKKHSILLCHDNPYSFILNKKPVRSIFNIKGAKEVAIELNSLSKSHNMPGWRVGALIANASIVNQVITFKSNMDSGMFYAVQMAAAKALSLSDLWYDSINKIYAQRRKEIYKLLDALKCSYSENQTGMFVWAKIPSSYKNGAELSDEILNRAFVFITPGFVFGSNGDRYIRASLCASEEKIKEAQARVKAL